MRDQDCAIDIATLKALESSQARERGEIRRPAMSQEVTVERRRKLARLLHTID